MNTINRTISILSLTLAIICLTNCTNSDDGDLYFESTAVILGFDKSMQMCRGDWIIEIDGHTDSRRFESLPGDSDIDLFSATFPLRVDLNWSPSGNYCGIGIDVESIRLSQ